ncbi:MAG TPA: V-type ATP synthase subunit D [candidate division Zixibacteria bacterium]|nr:V-type ATP synthase subunit D [candidate division Zixibacteria bacterium]
MENVSPTRMNLLARKGQVSLARQGVDLLKKKRDALVSEFFSVVRTNLGSRERLNAASQEAVDTLNLAVGLEGRAALESLGLAGRREIDLSVSERNVWGIKIPEVGGPSLRRRDFERGYSPATASARALDASALFEEALDLMVEVAGSETRIKKLGSEIKKTTRRVNALEQIVIPRIFREIGYIKSVLEQREREDIFRLKMIKRKSTSEKSAPGGADG